MEGRRARRLPVVLTKDEGRVLLQQPNRRAPTGLRNYVLMAVMLRAGLRISEALALHSRHIDAENSLLRVEDGKGGVDRTVPVEPWLVDALHSWADRREGLRIQAKASWRGSKSNGPLFVTLKGEPLDTRYVRAMVKREAHAAGIDKDVHPHTLRHTYATELLADGFTLPEVQQLMGHSSISTTMIYIHVNPVHLAQRIRARAM